MKSQNHNLPENLPKILETLASGHFATIPTETVEGYAAALSSEQGIRELMEFKERDFNSCKIFTLVPESKSTISKYAIIPAAAKSLIDQYIPGELTIILPKNPNFRHFYYDHFDTIGIRIPNHPLFPKLLAKTGALLLTSANKKGGTPKSTTGHLPSTIIDLTKPKPQTLRQGNLKIEL